MIAAIASLVNQRGIGFDNKLLFRIPEDMKFFKQITTNNVVIMGRKTFASMHNKPLKDRVNVILTRDPKPLPDTLGKGYMTMYKKEIDNIIKNKGILYPDKDIFIIGGAQVYELYLKYCDTLYLTHIDIALKYDTMFPDYEAAGFEKHRKILEGQHEDTNYEIWEYKRSALEYATV